ncbi:YbjN domain-containing protein [Erythrobacter sp.]|uniref:YbjN domain-containing protein n=1 Tax=Erythrobacter sp. TaxID=1042 RepID=UPI001425E2D2|nr:YbjN domain-containing protein [Erythrobacter sp.]QIQ85938.1 MAG: YbjN domain-containing protein [Erythrobacter sp.]
MKRTTLFIALAGLMAAAVAGPAAAQESEPLETFSRADLIAALEANGAMYEELADSRSINVTFASGVFANAVLLACTDDDLELECYGTSILATFNREGRSDAEVAQAINTYNYRENFGRAYVDPDGTISVRLYIIADGGITRENYKRQIELWENSLNDFFDYLYGEEESEGEDGAA